MGSGKGSIDSWAAVVKAGTIMFELNETSREVAHQALHAASYKLPIKSNRHYQKTNVGYGLKGGTINVPGRKPKLSRYARTIQIRGQFPGEPEEVYTRLPKREYEQRRELFDDPDYSDNPVHLADYSYDE
ncbi:12927_t:CDS:2 [Entrophospora sp. SA101]|nr:15424_t:CDS:2 [Entrophospora sp. SA101]CAJ0747023.1 12927_t:CDS:2 [Entrophospora sp. SA101]CAJ0844848.1 3804_t:CDS:2 [Entrophospora sp. SA101]CAJ0894362.1 13370_t:CDS:2 [Entrophospora sp. SA101]